MRYVYLIESSAGAHRYVGVTSDLKRRLDDHNRGKLLQTSSHAPWRLITYAALTDPTRANHFEHYLKSGSGHAFATRHPW